VGKIAWSVKKSCDSSIEAVGRRHDESLYARECSFGVMMKRPLQPSKATREREVFALFADAAHLPVVAGSIRSRPEPEPDILCELDGEGSVAFELVELVDSAFAEGIAVMGKTRATLRSYPAKLEVEAAATFQARYSDAMITVHFSSDVPLYRREKIIPRLFHWLIHDAPPGVAGLDCPLPATVRPAVSRVAIQRGAPMLMLDTGFSARLIDPTLAQMRRKLQDKNKYLSPHPRELLAYTLTHLLPPDDVWLEACGDPIRKLLDASAFRRVSVFAMAQRHEPTAVKLIYPPR
jgi:hypothetical protein